MIVIKVNFGQDLRRFSLEDLECSLFDVEQRVRKLFGLPLTNCGVQLSAVEDGRKLAIRGEKEWKELLQQSNNSSSKLLRLELERVINNQFEEPQVSAPLKKEEEITHSDVFNTPEFKKKLEAIVLETLTAKPFVDSIVEKVSDYLKQTYSQPEKQQTAPKPTLEVTAVISETIPQVVSSTFENVKQALNELKGFIEKEEKPVEEPQQEAEVKEEIPESSPVDEKNDSAKEVVEDDVSPDSFVLVPDQPHQEKKLDLNPAPLVKSVISFFRGLKKENKEKQIPNEQLEDMLKKLADMGFTDREANTKVLKFHHNYNEGLDAVVEDLLAQSSITVENKDEKKEEAMQEPEQDDQPTSDKKND